MAHAANTDAVGFEQRGSLGLYSSHNRWAQFGKLAINVDANPASRHVKIWGGRDGFAATFQLTPEEAVSLAHELLRAVGTLTVTPDPAAQIDEVQA